MLFARVDDWIITHIFEPISHEVQRRTGHTCYYIAWWFAGLSMIVYFLNLSQDTRKFFEGGMTNGAYWVSLAMFPLIMVILIRNLWELHKLHQKGRSKSPAMSILRTPFHAALRIAFIIAIPAFFATDLAEDKSIIDTIINHGGFALWVISDYFAVCTPLPPGFERRQTKTKEHLATVTH